MNTLTANTSQQANQTADQAAEYNTSRITPMQQALGEQWHDLPRCLQQHYTQRDDGSSHESGWLTINYPRWMQWPLNIMRHFGILVNKSGDKVPTQVNKHLVNNVQYWARVISYPDAGKILFNSHVSYDKDNIMVEHVNALLAMRLRVSVNDGKLYYHSCGYLLKLGKWQLNIPEWLAIGYGYIEETALSNDRFSMNFHLQHPLLGELFRYRGEFKVDQ